jgi:hypothetical protein
MQRFWIGPEIVGDEFADMGHLGNRELARLPREVAKAANLVEGINGNIKLHGVARQPRDPVRGLEEKNPFGRGQPIKAVVVDPLRKMVGMVVDLPMFDLDGPAGPRRSACPLLPLSPAPDLT